MSQTIHSVYLSAEEEELVREVAEVNGTSVNFVIRTAVRRLLERPAPQLALPERATSSD